MSGKSIMVAVSDGEYAVGGLDGKTHKLRLFKGEAVALPYNPGETFALASRLSESRALSGGAPNLPSRKTV